MLFSEKMALVPQPRRAALWREYRTLSKAAALSVRLQKEDRIPTPEELTPLRQAARRANEILSEFGMSPSFYPEEETFFSLLTEELTRICQASSDQDERRSQQ